MFIAALFTIAKIWKQLVSIKGRMYKDIDIPNGILFNHEKERNSVICNNMHGP